VPYLKTVWSSFGVQDVRHFRIGSIESSKSLVSDETFLAQKTAEMLKTFGLNHA